MRLSVGVGVTLPPNTVGVSDLKVGMTVASVAETGINDGEGG